MPTLIGSKFYSGVGGQADFMTGAARSQGGKPIIALPSTALNGSISRIVPVLDLGAGVTTTRNDVHFVVTEYGVARLFGKSVRKRAEALISVAHPDFREALAKSARERHLLQLQNCWHAAWRAKRPNRKLSQREE